MGLARMEVTRATVAAWLVLPRDFFAGGAGVGSSAECFMAGASSLGGEWRRSTEDAWSMKERWMKEWRKEGGEGKVGF